MERGDAPNDLLALRMEHAALLDFAGVARRAISCLRPDELRERQLPLAMDEIGMIVQTSEEAANEIMDAVENILRLSGEVQEPAVKMQIEACCHRVFAACSFQDLNGQRMAKLVETLLLIEDKLGSVERALSGGEVSVDPAIGAENGERDALLNGPAMPGEGLDQNDIDRMFSDAM